MNPCVVSLHIIVCNNPARNCWQPVTFSISNFNTVKIALSMIHYNTSPTPISLTPGELPKGINQHATNPSMLFESINSSQHNIQANNAIV